MYNEIWGSFPPAFVVDEEGRPLYSWRVLILPYLEEQALYEQFDLTKAWDAPENRRLLDQMPYEYGCPSHTGAQPGTTSYAGVFGPRCIFRGANPVRLRDITDGTSNTIMVGEAVGANIPWTKPVDIDVDIDGGLSDANGFMSPHSGGCHFALADGMVRFISSDINTETLKNLFYRNDGNPVPVFW